VYVRNWRRWRRREAMEADVERTDTAAAATGGAVPATGYAPAWEPDTPPEHAMTAKDAAPLVPKVIA
jgi:hypothetical protein